METLHVLEQKMAQLVALVKELQEQNKSLKDENTRLMHKSVDLSNELDEVKTSLLTGKEEREEEKALTRMTVDEIIKNIDSLMSRQEQL